MGSVLHEVIRPDMVRSFGAQTDARPVIEPKPSPLRLLWRNLQPFTFPDALDPLVIHMPAGLIEQTRDHAIPVAPVLAGKFDDVIGQSIFIRPATWNFALCRSMLSQDTTGSALRYAEDLPSVVYAPAPTRRA